MPKPFHSFLQVIKSYHGSLNMKSIPNPLAFVLFEQTIKNITLLPRYTDPSDPGFVGIRLLNISEFAADHQLDGNSCCRSVFYVLYTHHVVTQLAKGRRPQLIFNTFIM